MGPTVLTDNTFVSPPNATSPAVLFSSLYPPDCVSVGNIFTNNNTISCAARANAGNGRLIKQDDQVVSASSINQTPPQPPQVLPNYKRAIFDVRAGSKSAAIQQAIQQASGLCGQRPVVHLPYGSYFLDRTVSLPANCDIQLVGDGDKTALRWVGAGS